MRDIRANSARRKKVMDEIAEVVAKASPEFQEFVKAQPVRSGQKPAPTWRRLETFIKQQFEAGTVINIVIEPSGGD